jgi:2-C-methyl-D-erythritol 4-phosphate cytidylyltransferase
MKTVAIVLAAGSGSRMNSDVKKQYMEIGGKPLIYYSLKAFEESIIDDIVLVVSRGDVDFVKKEIVEKYGFDKVTAIVEGGLARYHSVRLGFRQQIQAASMPLSTTEQGLL